MTSICLSDSLFHVLQVTCIWHMNKMFLYLNNNLINELINTWIKGSMLDRLSVVTLWGLGLKYLQVPLCFSASFCQFGGFTATSSLCFPVNSQELSLNRNITTPQNVTLYILNIKEWGKATTCEASFHCMTGKQTLDESYWCSYTSLSQVYDVNSNGGNSRALRNVFKTPTTVTGRKYFSVWLRDDAVKLLKSLKVKLV